MLQSSEHRIDGLFYEDKAVELVCGERRFPVKPDDGTDESGIAYAIREFTKLLKEPEA